MSRTYKTSYGYFRPVRGNKQAIISEARKKAIPPNSWDDIPYDKQCFVLYKIALGLHKKGWEKERIIKHLKIKYKIKEWIINNIIIFWDYWPGCNCHFCNKKNKEYMLYLYENNPYKQENENIIKPWR